MDRKRRFRPTDYSKANEGEDFEDIW